MAEPTTPGEDNEHSAELVPFPGYGIEPDVIEGEIVGEPPPSAPAKVVRVVQVAVRHEHTKRAGRHLAYIPLGAAVVTKRLWESRTTARYERMFRGAEAAGNHEAALEWEKRLAEFRKDRHTRRVDMIKVPVEVMLAVPKIALGVFIVFAAFGTLLAIGTHHIAEVAVPFVVAAHVAELVAIVLSVTWGPIVLAVPWVAVAMLWHVGRVYASTGNGWLAAKKDDAADAGLVVTADTVTLALRNLPIPALSKAFKDGWQPTFYTQPVREGLGYATVYSLPARRHRADDRRQARRARPERPPRRDRGMAYRRRTGRPRGHLGSRSGGPVQASARVPATPRGNRRRVPGRARWRVATRRRDHHSRSSATTSCAAARWGRARATPAASSCSGARSIRSPSWTCSCSPTTVTSTPTSRASPGTSKGVEDDAIAAAVQRLQELYAEVARREGRLADLGAKKVTRQLAKDHRDLRPIVALFSECHELFGHDDYGAIAAELATKTIKARPQDRHHAHVRHSVEPQGSDTAKAGRAGQRQLPVSTSRSGGATTVSWATDRSLPVSARRNYVPAGTVGRA